MAAVSVEEVLEAIKKAKVITNADKLDPSVLLSEQDVDSLDLSGMLLSIEEAFGIEIPDEDIDGIQTINDIVVYINVKN
jgi:Phosphopantetheine attachment site.